MPHKVTPLGERFWAKVQKADGDACWEWQACLAPQGYGRIGARKGPPLLAHRVSWELHNGPIPDGLFVCHRCDNKKCVRPDHLFLGTAKDNTQDAVAKGRNFVMPRKTHCVNGHELSVYKDRQKCWVCSRAQTQRYRKERREGLR